MANVMSVAHLPLALSKIISFEENSQRQDRWKRDRETGPKSYGEGKDGGSVVLQTYRQ